VEIVARAVLIDDEYVYPYIHFGIDCVLEVALQGLHDDAEWIAEGVADERMRRHKHVRPQLIDEAALLVLRGRDDDLLHHLLHCHGRSVRLHDPLVELQKELQTNALVGQLHHGRKVGVDDRWCNGCTTKIFVRLLAALNTLRRSEVK